MHQLKVVLSLWRKQMKFLSRLFGSGRREPTSAQSSKFAALVNEANALLKGGDKLYLKGDVLHFVAGDGRDDKEVIEAALTHLTYWCSNFYHKDTMTDWRAILERWLGVGWGIRDVRFDYSTMLRLADAWHRHESTAGGQEVRFIERGMQRVPRPPDLGFVPTPEEFAALASGFRADYASWVAEKSGRADK
jgi:hypothetical protein